MDIRSLWKNPIGRLRLIGYLEGASFLVLLGIAMPLKYFAGRPGAVRVVGMLHGILFILFCITLANARLETGWSMRRTGRILLAALLPFGPFVIDRGLRDEETRYAS